MSALARPVDPASAPVRFTDGVLQDIADAIASVAPERGAALLGLGDLVTLAVHDTFGDYSSVSWNISSELNSVVQDLERAGAGHLMGTVHSHPRGVSGPSGTDIASTASTLRLNPHIDSLVVAIVTEGAPHAPHHLPIGRTHRMSLQRVRLEDDRPIVEPMVGDVMPVIAGARDAGLATAGGVTAHDWRTSAAALLDDLPLCGRFRGRDSVFLNVGGDLPRALVVPTGFPLDGPLVVEVRDGAQHLLSSPWDPAAPARRQVATMLALAAGAAPQGSLDRAIPVVGHLSECRVVVAGLGSVGSRITEDLVRAGVGRLTIIDPDVVEAPNLARSVYTTRDLGDSKTAALDRRLREIAPATVIERITEPLGEIDIAQTLAGADLVIGATDDMREQLLLAHHAYAAGVPMVCCAMYALAKAGEIVIALPEMGSPCVACSLGDGRSINQFRPEKDYGLRGRLIAEPGLGASIQLVASTASLVALALLSGPKGELAPLIAESVSTNRTLAMIATQPNWAFFPDVIGGPTQIAPQSVWIRVERARDCVVCGAADARVVPPSGKFVEGLAEVLSAHRGQPHAASTSTPDSIAAPLSFRPPTAAIEDGPGGDDADGPSAEPTSAIASDGNGASHVRRFALRRRVGAVTEPTVRRSRFRLLRRPAVRRATAADPVLREGP